MKYWNGSLTCSRKGSLRCICVQTPSQLTSIDVKRKGKRPAAKDLIYNIFGLKHPALLFGFMDVVCEVTTGLSLRG